MKKTFNNLKFSLRFLSINKKIMFFLGIFGIISVIISSILPTINGLIINNVLKLSYTKIILFAILGGVFQILNSIIIYIVNKKYFILRKEFIINLRKQLCLSLINYHNNVYDQEGVGTLLSKIKNDSKLIANFLYDIKDGILGLLLNIGVIAYIIYLNYIIGLYYLIVLIISIMIRYYGVQKAIKYQKISIEESDSNDNNLSEIIKGYKDIKVTNLKNKFTEKNNKELINISNNLFISHDKNELYISIAKLIESVFSGLMVIISVILIKNNLLSVSKFIIIFMYKGSIFTFPSKVGILISSLGKFNISCDRIFSVFNNEKESYGIINKKLNGEIKFENVSFYYKKNNIILNKINFKIKKNSYTVILGKNGIGKSTILNLISKIIEPTSGNIFIDKYNLKDLSEESIRNSIVLIPQQPYLFNFSIIDNLSLVNENKDKIIEVCKLVGIHDKIMSFKDNYNTIIGSDGCMLSGGEKQKIVIARALLTNAKILLFDEITNNLDKESINSINILINKLKGKYTIIMITHNNILGTPDNILEMVNAKTIKVIK